MKQTTITYEIKIKEHLDSHWSEWLGGMRLTYAENDETVLTGAIRDQAALYGILDKLRDLGVTLLSVQRVAISNQSPSVS
ncbi:hypothetical protein L0337_29860 [candidate division KSB1 bacterium]|nr:hypothetical protein [candidate division KSB1 bacterium]